MRPSLSWIAAGTLGALSVGALSSGVWSPWPCCGAPPEGAEDGAVHGRYFESRTATVFGGACHINSEAFSQGRQALCAWRIGGGSQDGVDLAGVELAAVLSAESNLASAENVRSVVYVDGATEAVREAALTWLLATEGAALGTVERCEASSVQITWSGDDFRVVVDGVAELEGSSLADRSCCTMQDFRWYEPLAHGVGDAIVGFTRRCRVEPGTLTSWSYDGANTAFVASF